MATKATIAKAKKLEKKWQVSRQKNQKMDKPTRRFRFCKCCGRTRGYIRYFDMCRICVRELAGRGELTGFFKSSL